MAEKKTKGYVWTEEHEELFQTLKGVLTAEQFLIFPQSTGAFILDTDASDVSIGAALYQVREGIEQPISFASKALIEAQRRYCTTRKELLAVVTFTRQFRHYLLGR